MATDQAFVEYLQTQSGLGADLSFKKMFGEYALYLHSKVVAFACDNQLFLKPTDAGRGVLGEVAEAHAYPGSKLYFRLDEQIEDRELLRRALTVTASALPLPKPKPKPASGKKAKPAATDRRPPAPVDAGSRAPMTEGSATSGTPADWEARLEALWAALPAHEPAAFVSAMRALVAERPEGDAAGLFELAGAEDSTGHADRAVPLYRAALAGGLDEARRRQATIQLASSLRILGRAEEALELLKAESLRPDDGLGSAVAAFRALALGELGREREALGHALQALSTHLTRYRASLGRYAAALVTAPSQPAPGPAPMFDHVKIGASDYAASKAFFLAALAPLGVRIASEGPPSYGIELSTDNTSSLCLAQAEARPAPLHLAFAARHRAQVDAFHHAALQAGGRDNGAPGLRPQYHASYYAAFVIGPDGHNVEAVCHRPEA